MGPMGQNQSDDVVRLSSPPGAHAVRTGGEVCYVRLLVCTLPSSK